MSLSRKERQRIVDDFVEQNGKWDARAFYEEVKRTQGQHPAWTWFTWDDENAADEYRVWEARTFVRNLKVKFSVEVISRGKINVRYAEAPLVFSPLSTRQHGGGYVSTDPSNADNMGMLCAEAAKALRSWLDRYGGVLAYAGASSVQFGRAIKALEDKASHEPQEEVA